MSSSFSGFFSGWLVLTVAADSPVSVDRPGHTPPSARRRTEVQSVGGTTRSTPLRSRLQVIFVDPGVVVFLAVDPVGVQFAGEIGVGVGMCRRGERQTRCYCCDSEDGSLHVVTPAAGSVCSG